ncbi:MFS transporter [Microbacterium sp. RD1]|uniref:MFS transporter n=1 Tax=Microbacterium sp. RD1 TaxID=3457313 RepID=UPI003FA53493
MIFWSTLDRSLILPLVPAIADDLDTTVAAAAGAITAHALAYAALQLLWGPLSTRWGRVRVLVLSTALAAAANLVSALAPDMTTFLLARTASGGAFAATFAAVLTYFGDMLPMRRRPAAMANLATATALGLAVGTVAAGAIGSVLEWRWIFGGFALVTALLVPLLAALPDSADRGTERILAQVTRLARNPWALGVCALVALEGVLLIGIFNLLPVALQQSGEDVFVAGLVTASFGVTVVVVSQLMKLVVGRVRPWQFLVAGGASATAAFVALAIHVSALSVLVGAALMGVAWALAHTTFQTWMTDAAADSRALGMTLFSISLMAGGALGAALGAAAIDSRAFGVLFAGAVGGAAVLGVVSAVARARYRNRDI